MDWGGEGQGQSFFQSLLVLDYFQLEIIHIPERHFGMVNFVPLQPPDDV